MSSSTTTNPSDGGIITLFTSIQSIGPALKQIQQQQQQHAQQQSSCYSFQINEIRDPEALNGYGGTVHFDPTKLASQTIKQLQEAEILVTEPHVLAKLLQYQNDSGTSSTRLLPKLQFCQSTYAGVDPLSSTYLKRATNS